MFDFFRDFYNEARGVNIAEIKANKRELQKKKKAETIIFSNKGRVIISVIGALFLTVAATSIALDVGKSYLLTTIAKQVFLLAVDVTTLIFLWKKGKRNEIIALVGIGTFVVSNYVLTFAI